MLTIRTEEFCVILLKIHYAYLKENKYEIHIILLLIHWIMCIHNYF